MTFCNKFKEYFESVSQNGSCQVYMQDKQMTEFECDDYAGGQFSVLKVRLQNSATDVEHKEFIMVPASFELGKKDLQVKYKNGKINAHTHETELVIPSFGLSARRSITSLYKSK